MMVVTHNIVVQWGDPCDHNGAAKLVLAVWVIICFTCVIGIARINTSGVSGISSVSTSGVLGMASVSTSGVSSMASVSASRVSGISNVSTSGVSGMASVTHKVCQASCQASPVSTHQWSELGSTSHLLAVCRFFTLHSSTNDQIVSKFILDCFFSTPIV